MKRRPLVKISMHAMAIESFVPMLESLAALLDKGEAFARGKNLDLVEARLAPDMYPLAQQVQLACYNAKDGAARLAGEPWAEPEAPGQTIAELKAQIAATIKALQAMPAIAFEGSETRDCSIEPADADIRIAMNGLQFLRGWALPHFYFHVVTAYDILRHNGVVIGKQDYLSQIGAFVRPKR
jgi:hypothetical protein